LRGRSLKPWVLNGGLAFCAKVFLINFVKIRDAYVQAEVAHRVAQAMPRRAVISSKLPRLTYLRATEASNASEASPCPPTYSWQAEDCRVLEPRVVVQVKQESGGKTKTKVGAVTGSSIKDSCSPEQASHQERALPVCNQRVVKVPPLCDNLGNRNGVMSSWPLRGISRGAPPKTWT
jgi:hypothetical protein